MNKENQQFGCALCFASASPTVFLEEYKFTSLLGQPYVVFMCTECYKREMTAIRNGSPATEVNLNWKLAKNVLNSTRSVFE